jgi:hypothetical protein
MLLATFEADSGTSSELRQARRRRQKEKEEAATSAPDMDSTRGLGEGGGARKDGKDPRSDYMGCKYLTSSQLFLLELQDPSIRQQLAIQLLVCMSLAICFTIAMMQE